MSGRRQGHPSQQEPRGSPVYNTPNFIEQQQQVGPAIYGQYPNDPAQAYLSPSFAVFNNFPVSPALSPAGTNFSFTDADPQSATGNTTPQPSFDQRGAYIQYAMSTQYPQMMSSFPPVVNTIQLSQAQLDRLDKILEYLMFSSYPTSRLDVQGFNELGNMLQEALSFVNIVIQPQPHSYLQPEGEPEVVQQDEDNNRRHECRICPQPRRKRYINRGTFVRHLTTEHALRYEYNCPYCPRSDCFTTNRKDKLQPHVRAAHEGTLQLTPRVVDAHTRQLQPPESCMLCHRIVSSWEDFVNCVCSHCVLSASENQYMSGRSNNRRDGNGGGQRRHQFGPSPGSGGGMSGSPGTNPGNAGFTYQDTGYGGGNFSYQYHASQRTGNQEPAQDSVEEALGLRLGNAELDSVSSPKPSSLFEHHYMLKSKSDFHSKRTEKEAPAQGKISPLPIPRASSQGQQGKDSPKARIDKRPNKDSTPLQDAKPKRSCKKCGHVLDDCKECRERDGAVEQCHSCADKSCQKMALSDACIIKGVHHEPGRRPYDHSSQPVGMDQPKELLNHTLSGEMAQIALKGDQSLLAYSKSADTKGQLSAFRMITLALRLKGMHPEEEDDSKEKIMAKFTTLQQIMESVKDQGIPHQFEVTISFERYLYKAQVKGSFLTCVHERLTASKPQRLSVPSLQDVTYQRVALAHETHPESPSYHLFYLAQGKNHESSDANLDVARQTAPKRGAHLRVRIRAIGRVLALRAAVSKTPLAVDKTETDGWELGIPLPSLATEDDVVKVITWLVQILVVFLRMPRNPKIYVMLAGGCWDVPRLTESHI